MPRSNQTSIVQSTVNRAMNTPFNTASSIFQAATSILKIHGLSEPRWRRNVASGARIGPWLQANYTVVDERAWKSKGPCLYLVQANDGGLRYVGISRNGVRHRWRESPALDASTMQPLAKRQLFHSQCWKHMESEYRTSPHRNYEVRFIEGGSLRYLLSKLGGPLSGLLALGDDDEGMLSAVERWLCNNQSNDVARWNVAMTGK